MTIPFFLNKLVNKENLSQKEAEELLEILVQEETMPAHIAAILAALCTKGETQEEFLGFINGMRRHAKKIIASEALDVCGTGGDGSGTFNISTAVSFVVAGVGVPVAKHGNRAASSLCGSADVLEALGVNILLAPSLAQRILKKTGIVFLFAPLYHSSFKQVSQVRKQLGIKTIFNLLGPFVSPAGVVRQLIGVPNKTTAKLLASVAAKLSYKHLAIITSSDGLDEAGLNGKTYVYTVKGNLVRARVIDSKNYGFKKIAKEQLQGADAQYNAGIILAILHGEKSAYRDAVIFNSALALFVAGKARTIKQGVVLSEQAIDSGAALRVLETLRKETQINA